MRACRLLLLCLPACGVWGLSEPEKQPPLAAEVDTAGREDTEESQVDINLMLLDTPTFLASESVPYEKDEAESQLPGTKVPGVSAPSTFVESTLHAASSASVGNGDTTGTNGIPVPWTTSSASGQPHSSAAGQSQQNGNSRVEESTARAASPAYSALQMSRSLFCAPHGNACRGTAELGTTVPHEEEAKLVDVKPAPAAASELPASPPKANASPEADPPVICQKSETYDACRDSEEEGREGDRDTTACWSTYANHGGLIREDRPKDCSAINDVRECLAARQDRCTKRPLHQIVPDRHGVHGDLEIVRVACCTLTETGQNKFDEAKRAQEASTEALKTLLGRLEKMKQLSKENIEATEMKKLKFAFKDEKAQAKIQELLKPLEKAQPNRSEKLLEEIETRLQSAMAEPEVEKRQPLVLLVQEGLNELQSLMQKDQKQQDKAFDDARKWAEEAANKWIADAQGSLQKTGLTDDKQREQLERHLTRAQEDLKTRDYRNVEYEIDLLTGKLPEPSS
ncbi:unnamed protein product [Amoebophrya sp. A25]|nr:unnamed protein product [Amoebophrya sp. A25]|eukprot:GSA25T00022770001.1